MKLSSLIAITLFTAVTWSQGVETGVVGVASVDTAVEPVEDAGESPQPQESPITLPEPLTSANFDRVLSEGIHFVEFFSPYCSHCKALAPTWEKFYETMYTEAAKNGVFIHQVDCVASGDLCERESIYNYPTLRLYGPNEDGTGGKLLTSFMKLYQRNLEGLSSFLREQAIDLSDDILTNNGAGLHQDVVTHMIDSTEMMEIIAGKNSVPMLVSFWPTTNEQLNEETFQKDFKDTELFRSCSRCFDFRNIWNLVSNSLVKLTDSNEVSLGYFNCKSDEKLCQSLGMKDLILDQTDSYDPKVFMFLPTDEGGNKIRYKSTLMTSKSIVDWSKRLLETYKFEDITKSKLSKKMKLVEKLDDRVSELEKDPMISIVYYYSPETHVAEDDIILRHLIQPVMDMPSNVRLYKSSDPSFVDLLKVQEQSLVEYINKGITDEQEKLEFSEEMFTARTLSTVPMFMCFKDNSLISTVHQGFGSRDTRNYKSVLNFIKVNSNPLIEEFSENNKDLIFGDKIDPAINSKNEKVLIVVTDSKRTNDFFKLLSNMSHVVHRFHFVRLLKQYSKLVSLREKKYDKVADIKAKDGDSTDIIRALREEVPNVFRNQENNLQVVYVDKSNLRKMFELMEWTKLDAGDFDVGDALVVSKFGNNYWNKEGNEKLVVNEVQKVTRVLEQASFEGLSGQPLRARITFEMVSSYGVVGMVVILLVMRLKRYRFRLRRVGYRGVSPGDVESATGKFD